MGRLSGTLWCARFSPALQRRFVQRVAVVRVCGVLFRYQKLRSATIESHLSAIKFFHRISRGFELDTTHFVIACALKGAARSHADVGNQATVRRPVSWAMLLAGESLIPSWGTGSGPVACSVCVVLFLNSHVGNVCRVAVAYSRDLLFTAG